MHSNITPQRSDVTSPAIEFDGVTRSFGSEIIYRDLTFKIPNGEFTCIVGPSGCGKSTALRLIGGLLPATSGRIAVTGLSPEEAWERIAYVFQSPRLAPWRKAIDNVTLAEELRFGRDSKSKRAEKAQSLLDLVGLADAAEKYPYMLSGGERQRVALARALAVEPEIILMDEPFSALDPSTRRKLRVEIIDIWRKTGKTIVFVTHDIDEALVLADRILVLSQKPAVVVQDLRISDPRPRSLDDSPTLMALRNDLLALFQSMGGSEDLTQRDS